MSKIILCLLTFLVISTARAETITIVADEWCPYNCVPNSDKPGVMIEIAKKAFEPLGITVDYKTIPWTRALQETRQGKFTAITGASHGDAEDFIFPEHPQAQAIMTFYTKKDSTWVYNGIESLQGISLGSIDGYSYSDELDAYIEQNKNNLKKIQIISGNGALEINIKKLAKGRINALIESTNVLRYHFIEHSHGFELREAGHLPLTDNQNLYIAFSPKLEESKRYAKILSDTTKALIDSGEIKSIFARYGLEPMATPEHKK